MPPAAKRPWDCEPDDDSESTAAPSTRHPWDDIDDNAADRSDIDSDVDEDAALENPNAALQAFFNLFIDLYMTSTISASTFCIGCFYLGVAQVGGKNV